MITILFASAIYFSIAIVLWCQFFIASTIYSTISTCFVMRYYLCHLMLSDLNYSCSFYSATSSLYFFIVLITILFASAYYSSTGIVLWCQFHCIYNPLHNIYLFCDAKLFVFIWCCFLIDGQIGRPAKIFWPWPAFPGFCLFAVLRWFSPLSTILLWCGYSASLQPTFVPPPSPFEPPFGWWSCLHFTPFSTFSFCVIRVFRLNA